MRRSPVCVALRKWVGDVGSGHEEESPRHMNDAAEGQGDEGGVERDSLLMQNLGGIERKRMMI